MNRGTSVSAGTQTRPFIRFSDTSFFRGLRSPLNAQQAHPGRGAVSAQDLAKLTSPAGSSGSTAADQVCARFTAGSVVSAPPELESQNGVLEVTMGFLTVTDSQGLVRYCYVTNTGLEAPTLRVNPGDTSSFISRTICPLSQPRAPATTWRA